MVDADRRGRLFALAGDRIVRPGARELTLTEVAERTGGGEDTVRRLWRALGLAGWDSDDRVASAQDAVALAPMVVAAAAIGEDVTLELARPIGAALSRIGEATNAIFRSLSPAGALATSEGELETARFWARRAPFLPALGRVLDVFWRHHHDLAREHFERADSFDLMFRKLTRLAVGFVDMSGFTKTTEHLGEIEFARLMASFSTGVGETVHDLGGRVVKFVGDAAMIVAPDALLLATIVHELVESRVTVGEGLTLHAGLAQGQLLSQDGDYFGSAVNIAARLVALAGPGMILATEPVGKVLSEAQWSVEWLGPQPIRGIADPVVTCLVHHRAGSD
jgi:class 3 adenylate cyclase